MFFPNAQITTKYCKAHERNREMRPNPEVTFIKKINLFTYSYKNKSPDLNLKEVEIYNYLTNN